MSSIEIDELLAEIDPENPAGPDLRTQVADEEFLKLQAQIMADEEDKDWPELKTLAVAVLKRSKDLEAAIHLVRALTHTDSLPGLRDGFALVRGLLERYWDTYHPRNRPPLAFLPDLGARETLLRSLRKAVILRSDLHGEFGLNDIVDPDNVAARETAEEYRTNRPEDLEELVNGVSGAVEEIESLHKLLEEKELRPADAKLGELASRLKELHVILAPEARGEVPGAGPAAPAGVVASRQDAIRILKDVIGFFAEKEPSSPVPLLLRRAIRLVDKDFEAIVGDLAPGGLAEVKKIKGVDKQQE